ncbi:hypothetical protein TDB9533_00796 [Thalassocella blandensis]|nr:hypothetical protein TDB9533_00796 [Thalassocella blandensis]
MFLKKFETLMHYSLPTIINYHYLAYPLMPAEPLISSLPPKIPRLQVIALMKIVDSYTTLKTSDIEIIEKKLGITLPKDYRKFLLQNNGGKPIPDAVKLEGEYFDYVACFYGIRSSNYSDDLFRNVREYDGYIPPHYLPIGESPGGDIYCLSLIAEELGAVYYWDHELANYEGDPWEENMIKLAPALTEFLAGLYHEQNT